MITYLTYTVQKELTADFLYPISYWGREDSWIRDKNHNVNNIRKVANTMFDSVLFKGWLELVGDFAAELAQTPFSCCYVPEKGENRNQLKTELRLITRLLILSIDLIRVLYLFYLLSRQLLYQDICLRVLDLIWSCLLNSLYLLIYQHVVKLIWFISPCEV